MKIIYLSLGALLLLFFASFQKEKGKELPPLTHTGQNIMACRLNGKVIVADQNISDESGACEVHFSPVNDNDVVYISGVFISPRYDIEISFRYEDTLGTYPIIVSYPFYAYFWDHTNSLSPNDSNQFQPDAIHHGSVTVAYYSDSIISGTFNFDAMNRKGKVAHITEGRFDIARH